jgi:exodeoxyribonuclease X
MVLMLIRTIDFETTGMPPDAAICEVGWCDLRVKPGTVEIGHPMGMLVNPNRPMPPEARAIHHISDADVFGAPSVDRGILELMKGAPDAFCAHNAKFEREFFAGGPAQWICTLKVGRRLWPECPSHSNQTIRYFLDLELEDDLAMPPHRAAPDAYVTAHILASAIMAGTSVADMVKWSNEPSLLPGPINFGKHRGTPWSQLDKGYLRWITDQRDMDEDKKFTAKYWLEQR